MNLHPKLPEVQVNNFPGKLYVIEGVDGSGRSTQIALLKDWLEAAGHAVKTMGIKRSNLVSEELAAAQERKTLTRTTRSLFYATDFFDQLINEILPALHAGHVVLADRYVYTLMARDFARNAPRDWVRNVYAPALKPDAVFYLQVSLRQIIIRNFEKNKELEYWESGMDLALSTDMFDSFVKYQKRLQAEFNKLRQEYHFIVVNGNRGAHAIQREMRELLSKRLDISI